MKKLLIIMITGLGFIAWGAFLPLDSIFSQDQVNEEVTQGNIASNVIPLIPESTTETITQGIPPKPAKVVLLVAPTIPKYEEKSTLEPF